MVSFSPSAAAPSARFAVKRTLRSEQRQSYYAARDIVDLTRIVLRFPLRNSSPRKTKRVEPVHWLDSGAAFETPYVILTTMHRSDGQSGGWRRTLGGRSLARKVPAAARSSHSLMRWRIATARRPLQPFADALEDRNRVGALSTSDHCIAGEPVQCRI
jgi:hypothetical protein